MDFVEYFIALNLMLKLLLNLQIFLSESSIKSSSHIGQSVCLIWPIPKTLFIYVATFYDIMLRQKEKKGKKKSCLRR